MSDPSRETVQLIASLIGHMRQVVGDGACYAMLHYGALEEGKRLGAGSAPHELPTILRRVDELLQQKTEIIRDEGEHVTLRVHACGLFDADQRPTQGIVLGLVEGALTSSRAGRYKGELRAAEGELLVDLRRAS